MPKVSRESFVWLIALKNSHLLNVEFRGLMNVMQNSCPSSCVEQLSIFVSGFLWWFSSTNIWSEGWKWGFWSLVLPRLMGYGLSMVPLCSICLRTLSLSDFRFCGTLSIFLHLLCNLLMEFQASATATCYPALRLEWQVYLMKR